MTTFPGSYEESRALFWAAMDRIRALWPDAAWQSRALSGAPGLALDWIAAEPTVERDRLLILTAGEHGVEGTVGAAVLELFVDEFLARLDPATTGVLIVPCLNPWGMQHRRRTNAANVDLNRNFVAGGDYDPAFNPEYAVLDPMLNPPRPVRGRVLTHLAYAAGILRTLVAPGQAALRRATLVGQYRFPRGIYYGAQSVQEETQALIELYRTHAPRYRHVIQLDMHTGYGPRYQMSVVNSSLEPAGSEELARRFAYPLVVKDTPDEFYSIHGDMIDYLYALAGREFPATRLYAASFEFGTLGGSLLGGLRAVRALILENQAYWYGAPPSFRPAIAAEFEALFAPREAGWRAKALADARQAFEGILRAEGFLTS